MRDGVEKEKKVIVEGLPFVLELSHEASKTTINHYYISI
jgi:hypothetical protein